MSSTPISSITSLTPEQLADYGTILITGGTGRLGKPLLQRMAQLGFCMRVATPDPPYEHPNIEWVRTDFLEAVDFTQLMEGVTHVLHLGAELWNRATMDQVNGVASRELVKAAEAAGVKYFCYTSSICVYGSPTARRVTEETPLIPCENVTRYDYMENEFMVEYARTKRVGEKMIERHGSKCKYVVLRPTEISQEHDILKVAEWGKRTRMWRGGRHCHAVYYRDVMNAILFFLFRSTAPDIEQEPGEVVAYNLSHDDAPKPRFSDFMRMAWKRTRDERFKIPFRFPLWMEYVKEHIKWKVWKHCYPFGLVYIDPSKLYATGYRHEYGLATARENAIESLSLDEDVADSPGVGSEYSPAADAIHV